MHLPNSNEEDSHDFKHTNKRNRKTSVLSEDSLISAVSSTESYPVSNTHLISRTKHYAATKEDRDVPTPHTQTKPTDTGLSKKILPISWYIKQRMILKHNIYNQKYWMQLVKMYIYQGLKPLWHARYEAAITEHCNSLVATHGSLSEHFTERIYSLLVVSSDPALYNRCTIGQDAARPRVLIRSHMVSMDVLTKCSTSWHIQVSPVFSINTTIVTKHWELMETHCEESTDRPIHSWNCKCYTNLIIKQKRRFGMPRKLATICGQNGPQSVMVEGSTVLIELKQYNHIPSQITFVMQFQVVKRLDITYEHVETYTDTGISINSRVGSLFNTRNSAYVAITSITGHLMTTISADIQIATDPWSCGIDYRHNLSLLIVDGPITELDGLNHFPTHGVTIGSDTCPFTKQWNWTSTLNDATFKTTKTGRYTTINIILEYNIVPMKCQLPACYTSVEKVTPYGKMERSTHISGTLIYNHTFLLHSSGKENMELTITI